MQHVIRKQWPALTVYFSIAVSVLLVRVNFRVGVVLLALSVLLAFGLRLWLPDVTAGWLRSRRRRVDLTVLAVLGVTLLIFALVVPGPH